MIKRILLLMLFTFFPFVELRMSIPVGILTREFSIFGYKVAGFGMHWFPVFFICVITNMILGVILYKALDIFAKYFTKYSFFNKPYQFFVKRTQKKVTKYVDKYGLLGLALFISVPLPGSGSYSGALGAHILGISYKKFILANCIGVTIAGAIMTIAAVIFNVVL